MKGDPMYLAREFLHWLKCVVGICLLLAACLGVVVGVGLIGVHFGVEWAAVAGIFAFGTFFGTSLYLGSRSHG